MIQENQSQKITTHIQPLKDNNEKENKTDPLTEDIKETHYVLEDDETNIKEEKEKNDNNTQSEQKKVSKLYELVNKEELLAKQKEEEENSKKFKYTEEDFPTLSADLYINKAASNKKGGGGRKNKKKKFTEIAPDLLMQIETNLTLEEIDKGNVAKQKKITNKAIKNEKNNKK